jgi:hypothetical protein
MSAQEGWNEPHTNQFRSMKFIGTRLFALAAGATLIAGSAFAETPNPTSAPTAPLEAVPGKNLSEKLSRSNGVIHPKDVDPAIEKPAPPRYVSQVTFQVDRKLSSAFRRDPERVVRPAGTTPCAPAST